MSLSHVAGHAGRYKAFMRSAFFSYVLVLYTVTVYENDDARCLGHIEHQAMRSEQGLLQYIGITPYIASTGRVLAAQHHVHMQACDERNGAARRPESLPILILYKKAHTL
jgi:hypothetical protein